PVTNTITVKTGGFQVLKGVPASPGIAIGKAFVFTHGKLHYDKTRVEPDAVEREVARFEKALAGVQQELSRMRARTASGSGKDLAGAYEAQIAMLDDPAVKNDVVAKIRSEGMNAETAVAEVMSGYRGIFHALRAAYLRERAAELKELEYRLQRHLLGASSMAQPVLTEDSVVLAKDLTPSETIQVGLNRMIGLATERGGRTSHTAIMARNLDIPSVVGLGPFLSGVGDGDTVILDGSRGLLIINPDEATLADYRRREETYRAYKRELQALQDLPAETGDGCKIELLANIDHPGEVTGALANGAGGIGLFRTEYLFMGRLDAPGEEEQYQEYKKAAESMKGRPVVIRTLDIGGEGNYFCLPLPAEPNPFLGWRGIRLSLELKDIFKTQVRAILRAGAHGKVRMMFPMVSNLSEWHKAKSVVEEAKRELAAEGAAFDRDMETGLLVEVPSVALTVDLFAPHVDFFSIGTNDLVQYTMAVDRGNEKVSSLYQSLHPAVLRLMAGVLEGARKAGKEVAVCGEMAGEPLATVLLLGLGFTALSCGVGVLPEVKKRIRSVTMPEAGGIAGKALNFATSGEIRRFLEGEMRARRLYF
ncbi:MAG: phosphoenolpyruvate--protein phosphotransferase, partial [Peptococcaceae bacterium]|nr:phosphoenolpyruvate--protein phosphotransferase [Peptococcaceae bacterium]